MSALARRLVAAAAVLAATPAFAAKKPLGPADRVDLNRATVSELMRLPGVGQKKAQAIVAHRQKTPFRRPDDLLQVKGCGPRWLQRVKGNVSVGTPTAPPAAPGSAATTARR